MAVVDACRDAIAYLVGRRYTAVFANDDEICVEVAALSNEAARDIVETHPWQKMISLHTINGDGATQAWPLPPDYDRMVNGNSVTSGTWYNRRYENAGTLDNWIDLLTLQPAIPPGYWMIIDNKINFQPIISSGDSARFYYIRRNYATDSTGSTKAAFNNDSDDFILSNRLLKLSIIWRWKAMKGMDYGEDIRLYADALSEEISRDGGAREIRSRMPGAARNFRTAWPWSLGGV